MTATLRPGSVIGILGGGQLGRMTAQAAARLGYRAHVFCPEPDAPALQVTDRATLSGYEDRAALDAFARAIDVATFEFENIPLAPVAYLAERVAVHPAPATLATCQERAAEKRFVRAAGIATAPFATVDDEAGLADAVARIGTPAILKTRRLGYDGKGQVLLRSPDDAAAGWAALGRSPAILEGFVAFERELSVIAARSADGRIASFPPVENRHRDHILWQTLAPAALPAAVAAEACRIAETLAQRLDLVGLLAVEFFLAEGGRLLVNELAPRPHNSGHWTLDACMTSQFEQLVRAICGLPLGATDPLCPAVMTNLLGAEADSGAALLAEPGSRLHLYGKAESRPGRKMGHVTRLNPPRSGG